MWFRNSVLRLALKGSELGPQAFYCAQGFADCILAPLGRPCGAFVSVSLASGGQRQKSLYSELLGRPPLSCLGGQEPLETIRCKHGHRLARMRHVNIISMHSRLQTAGNFLLPPFSTSPGLLPGLAIILLISSTMGYKQHIAAYATSDITRRHSNVTLLYCQLTARHILI